MSKARDIANILSANTAIATDSEVSSAVSAHATALNGHVGRGATGNRPASPSVGDLYFDTTLNALIAYRVAGWEKVSQDPAPQIASISPTTAATTGTLITITGSNYKSGLSVQFIGTNLVAYNSPVATFVGASTATATTPDLPVAYEPYDIKVINNDNQFAVLENALDSGGTPTWNTASGTISTIYEQSSLNTSVSATDPDGTSIVYSSSNLPGWINLNSSTGTLTGTSPDLASDTTYSFDILASDGVNSSTRSFNVVANIFSVPSAPTIGTVTISGTTATVPFTAPTSNGGQTITSYTATSSPGGLTGTLNQSGSGSITVSGLSNGTAYTFTVTATNSVGTSQPSATSNSVTPTYTGQTVTGGSGYTNESAQWTNSGDSSITTSGSFQWTCSNQGDYYGGNQTIAAGGTAGFGYTLNNGNPLPAGTYSYSGSHYLYWDSGGDSHDGMPLWAVTPTAKSLIVNTVRPPDAKNTQITKTGTFTLSSPQTVRLVWNVYDGSSATSMGGRVYNFTVTKTA